LANILPALIAEAFERYQVPPMSRDKAIYSLPGHTARATIAIR
jgi:hypothetical protein